MSVNNPSTPQDFRFAAAVAAYDVARSLPVPVLTSKRADLWLVEFDDQDGTRVVVGPGQETLLAIGLPAGEAIAHFQAGHRTDTGGRGVADACSLCATADKQPTQFTHPEYRAPAAAPVAS